MARLHVITTIFVAANALSNLGSPLLKPERSTKNAAGKSKRTLPNVNDLLPSGSFSAMKSTVAALSKRLADEQKQSVSALRKLKDEYELKLQISQKNNSRVENDNLQIASRVEEVETSNNVLRRRASKFVKANELLKIQLEALSYNLSLAQEFVQEGLTASKTNGSEVQVLAELMELDEVARANSKKRKLLGDYNEPSRKLSLLATVGDVHERSANDIVESLASSLSQLSDEANTSKSMLREAFETRLSEVMTKHEALLRQQVSLNETMIVKEELHKRLSAAVEHLSKIHDHLLARVKAAKAFALRLGSHQPSAAAAGKVIHTQDTPEVDGRTPKIRSRAARTVSRNRSRPGRAHRTNRTPSQAIQSPDHTNE
jgi:hypothetical protein